MWHTFNVEKMINEYDTCNLCTTPKGINSETFLITSVNSSTSSNSCFILIKIGMAELEIFVASDNILSALKRSAGLISCPEMGPANGISTTLDKYLNDKLY